MNPFERLIAMYVAFTSPKDEKGAQMVEYVLLIALIALVVALAIPTLTTAISGLFTDVAGQL